MREPRCAADYTARQTEAARRVLVDVQQVLAGFEDSIVLIGGWVPDLLLPEAAEPHVGSIDVDLALDAKRLEDGRYAELLKLLLDTARYNPGPKPFQVTTTVDLQDGQRPVNVEVDFLAARNLRLRGKGRAKGFRVLQADGCAAAFRAPELIDVSGPMIDGVQNTVHVRVASLADFLVMKCHALAGRDKPKDAYDIAYCLDHVPGGTEAIAVVWRECATQRDVVEATRILREKFAGVDSFGPQRAAEFRSIGGGNEHAIAARRAFELVQEFLRACAGGGRGVRAAEGSWVDS
jgi:hypothetical protein